VKVTDINNLTSSKIAGGELTDRAKQEPEVVALWERGGLVPIINLRHKEYVFLLESGPRALITIYDDYTSVKGNIAAAKYITDVELYLDEVDLDCDGVIWESGASVSLYERLESEILNDISALLLGKGCQVKIESYVGEVEPTSILRNMLEGYNK
jgi:hypothetical protein